MDWGEKSLLVSVDIFYCLVALDYCKFKLFLASNVGSEDEAPSFWTFNQCNLESTSLNSFLVSHIILMKCMSVMPLFSKPLLYKVSEVNWLRCSDFSLFSYYLLLSLSQPIESKLRILCQIRFIQVHQLLFQRYSCSFCSPYIHIIHYNVTIILIIVVS